MSKVSYQPHSKILILTICSLNKKAGGTARYNEKAALSFKLGPESKNILLKNRNDALDLLWSGKIKWQGVPLQKLDYNKDLNRGEDFGGKPDFARYLPAINRYNGRFFGALGKEGRDKLLRSRHHVLFMSGLYGLVMPMEPIQLYSLPIEGKSKVKEIWKRNNGLTKILLDYIKIHGIKRVLDLTSRIDYRELIDWNTVTSDTATEVFYCFSVMGAGEDALIPFGKLMKNFMLEASEEELLAIEPETEMYGVIIRDIPETWDSLPKEELIRLRRAEREIAQLPAYSVKHIPHELAIPIPREHRIEGIFPKEGREWLISITSEFRKDLRHIGNRKKEGRILGAITELSQHPTEPRGDTVKPLSGSRKGEWRYRIGDYRLVYLPDIAKHVVYLLLISPRGSVYNH